MICILLVVLLVIGLWIILSLNKLDKKSTSRTKSVSVRRPQPAPRVTKVIPKVESDGFKAVKTDESEASPEFDIKVCQPQDRTLREPAPSSDKGVKWPLPMFPEPTKDEKQLLAEEKKFRKMATALKKEKRYDEAVECLKKARELQYQTSLWYDIKTILRVPEMLLKANRPREAYDEAMSIADFKWNVAGMVKGTMEETKHNLRFEALRVAYRSALAMENTELLRKANRFLNEFTEERVLSRSLGQARTRDIKSEFRENYETAGHDVGQICDTCWCMTNEINDKWNGRYISVLGKTKGLPTIEDALADGIFCCDDCCHRVDMVFPDLDEIPDYLKKLLNGASGRTH